VSLKSPSRKGTFIDKKCLYSNNHKNHTEFKGYAVVEMIPFIFLLSRVKFARRITFTCPMTALLVMIIEKKRLDPFRPYKRKVESLSGLNGFYVPHWLILPENT